MGWYLIYGTIPIAVFGLLFKDQIETGARDLRLIGWVLILFGIILWAVDHYFQQRKGIEDLNLRDGMLFGLAQSLALIPGVSRSGATIYGGLLTGLNHHFLHLGLGVGQLLLDLLGVVQDVAGDVESFVFHEALPLRHPER